MNDINSYPFNRIILDIVELLQDLRGQGMAYIAAFNGSGSFDFSLYADKETLDNWSNSEAGSKDFQALCNSYIMRDDTTAAHMAWNDLIKYKELDDSIFDLEAVLNRKEYFEDR